MAHDETKVKYIVRYLIYCAENKMFLQYDDMRKIFGVSQQQLGLYGAEVGKYCKRYKLPFLNALIINLYGSVGDGWGPFMISIGESDNWEAAVNDCFNKYHISQGKDRFEPYKGVLL